MIFTGWCFLTSNDIYVEVRCGSRSGKYGERNFVEEAHARRRELQNVNDRHEVSRKGLGLLQ